MEIERLISIFDKKTKKLLLEYNIDNIDINILKEIFKPKENDPLMYDPYTIKNSHIKELKKYVHIDFKFNKYFYQIDCFQK